MLLGVTELLLVMALIAVFFGAGKLPRVLEAMGHGVRQFREASRELDAEGGGDDVR